MVSKGQPLIKLDSPNLTFKIATAQEKILKLKWKLRNIATFLNEFSQQNVLLQELQHARAELSGLILKKERLTILAPFDGVIESLSSNLYTGLWVKGKQILVVMINRKKNEIYAYTTTKNHQKLNDGQTGYFVPENIDLKKIPITIFDIITYQTHELYSRDSDQQYSTLMDISAPLSAYHASTFGGNIAVRQDKEQKLLPEETIFKLELSAKLPSDYPIKSVVRGQVFLEVDRKSIAHRVWTQIAIFLVKETGF